MKKLNCSHCFRNAKWYYVPCDDPSRENRLYCDVHVSRGCSCQDDSNEPCCEYDYSPCGYVKTKYYDFVQVIPCWASAHWVKWMNVKTHVK